jgi:drug/metabolite transporter (DMT)-like permease
MSSTAIFLGEALTPVKLAASALILAGLFLTVFRGRTGQAPSATPGASQSP